MARGHCCARISADTQDNDNVNLRPCIRKRFRLIDHIAKISIVAILVLNVKSVSCDDSSEESELSKRMRIIESVSGRFFSDVYSNGTFRTGNSLWDNILNKCSVNPSVSCLQKNVYSYIDDSLKLNGDVDLGHGVCFKKNNVDISKYSKEANIIYLTGSKEPEESRRYFDEDNEIEHDPEPESPIEEVTDGLYDKGVKFLVTHDMKVTLPEWFFEGATLKISPRALTKTGALVHVDIEPRESVGEGRIAFHYLKKYIRKKLLSAAIAIILVVKVIALKLVFVLPLIMGITTAKKMFLKFLLFLFPALSHIFKLCSWYHNNYHTTKYHHHHHLITHHHKPSHSYGHPHQGSSLAVRPHSEGPPHTLEHYPQDWELSGPGLGNEYVASGISSIHRNAIANFKPDINDANDINSWGLGMPPGTSMNVGEYASNPIPQVAPNPNTGQRINLPIQGRPVGPPNPYRKKPQPKDPLQAEKEALIRAAALAARAPPSPVRDELLRVSQAKLTETNRVKAETDLVKQQQQILAAHDPELQAADRFYGNLLDRVDKILFSIGATEPGCKERAVCALYRDPFRHAPYSNLVSNELSKDSSELVPPADSKMALLYYQYVQAARDGQEEKDCSATYPNCNFEYNK